MASGSPFSVPKTRSRATIPCSAKFVLVLKRVDLPSLPGAEGRVLTQRMFSGRGLRPSSLPLQEFDEIEHFALLVRRQQKHLLLDLFYGTHFIILSGKSEACTTLVILYTFCNTLAD